MFEIPEGETSSDQRWQDGYNDAFDDTKPRSEDPVYISGWCQGYAGAYQCGAREAERAYLDALYAGGL